jgi:hypothetical protein
MLQRKTTEPPQRHRTTHPLLPTDHTDKHRWDHAGFQRAARIRPPNDGLKPLGRTAAPDTSAHRGVRAQRPVFICVICGEFSVLSVPLWFFGRTGKLLTNGNRLYRRPIIPPRS